MTMQWTRSGGDFRQDIKTLLKHVAFKVIISCVHNLMTFFEWVQEQATELVRLTLTEPENIGGYRQTSSCNP